MLSRPKLAAVSALLTLFVGSLSLALADYTILDSTSTTRTIKAFVCETTKVCPAHVLINSSGTEVGTAAAPVVNNTAQWASGTLGAMANYGTSPGAVLAPGVNAFVTNSNANGRATAANSSPVVLPSAASTAGAIAANNTTAVVVKASAGVLFGAQLAGIGTVPAYVKIYNATSATCGSGTPVKRLIIPAAATSANGAGSNVSFGPNGLTMGTGITYCITTGIGDADATAPAASTYLVNLDYE